MAISHDFPRVVLDGAQADVADGLAADLAVDDVGADQHLARLRLERVEVDVPAAQPGAVAGELGDPVGVDEDPAALALGDESDDARQRARPTGHGDDVLDPADRRPTGVEQRQAHHPERVDQVASHATKVTRGFRSEGRRLSANGHLAASAIRLSAAQFECRSRPVAYGCIRPCDLDEGVASRRRRRPSR